MNGVDLFGSVSSGDFIVPKYYAIERIIKYYQSTHFVVIGQIIDENGYLQIKAANKRCYIFIDCEFTGDMSKLFMYQSNLKIIFCRCKFGKGCCGMIWKCKCLELKFVDMNPNLANMIICGGDYHAPIGHFALCIPMNTKSRCALNFPPIDESESN